MPVPDAFLCPISMEIMADPVFAADGHSYERVAIETWFRSKQTSPMTNDAMPSTMLTPNRQLKSQIRGWQGRSSAQWVGDLISAVAMQHGDPSVVEGKLLELARFVRHHKAVVLPGTLKMLSAMLHASEQLWIAPVQHALQVAEAECKLIVAGLAAKLRDARRDEKLATVAATVARGKLAQLDIEVAAAEEALDKLRQQRSKQVQDMVELQRAEEQCRSSTAQVEQDLSGYPDPLALLEEGNDSEDELGEATPERQTRSKRKRAAAKQQSGTVVTKRPRGDGSTGMRVANAREEKAVAVEHRTERTDQPRNIEGSPRRPGGRSHGTYRWAWQVYWRGAGLRVARRRSHERRSS
eukprot:COSAG01_NODE_2178_length_8215_cov_128.540414_4_plen_353_part_00